MGVVSNIIDALRRIGSPTAKSALKRQDAYLEGQEVLGRGQVNIRDDDGPVHGFVATTEPIPEVVAVLEEADLLPIKENVAIGLGFLEAFGAEVRPEWNLDGLDTAFTAWQRAADKLGFSEDYVTEVLGAMFGQYCVDRLNMRWIKLTDQYGTTLAVEGVERRFRGFPYQTISKRIADSECGFFRPVFSMLRHQATEADVR